MKQVTLTDDEYRDVVMRRVEKSLREVGVVLPEPLRRELAALVPAEPTPPPRENTPQPSLPAAAATNKGFRPHHWPAPGARPVDRPSSNADRVLNAILGGCQTVPELARAIHKPPKAVYSAIWKLKRERKIDTGTPPPVDGRRG